MRGKRLQTSTEAWSLSRYEKIPDYNLLNSTSFDLMTAQLAKSDRVKVGGLDCAGFSK